MSKNQIVDEETMEILKKTLEPGYIYAIGRGGTVYRSEVKPPKGAFKAIIFANDCIAQYCGEAEGDLENGT